MKERREEFQHIREQLDDFELEVPSAGWQSMSAILDGDQPVPQPVVPEQRRRRFVGWFWLIGAFLLVGSAFWLGAQQEWPEYILHNQAKPLSALPIPLRDNTPEATNSKKITARTASSVKQASSGISADLQSARSPVTPTKENQPTTLPDPHRSAQAFAPIVASDTVVAPNTKYPKAPALLPQAAPDTAAQSIERVFAALKQLPSLPVTQLPETAPSPDLPDLYQGHLHRWAFGLKVGADYQALQTNALVGGFAQFRLHPKWVLEAGLQYKRRSADNGDGLGISPPQGDTVYLPAFASIAPWHRPLTRVHFLEAPVALQYQISNRIRVLAGLQVAYMRSTDRALGHSAFDNSASNEALFDLSRNQGRAEDAPNSFEQWDFGALAGLDYRLAPHWSLELRLQQGLRDLTPNAYYNNHETYSNSSLQLAVKWYW